MIGPCACQSRLLELEAEVEAAQERLDRLTLAHGDLVRRIVRLEAPAAQAAEDLLPLVLPPGNGAVRPDEGA